MEERGLAYGGTTMSEPCMPYLMLQDAKTVVYLRNNFNLTQKWIACQHPMKAYGL